MPWVYTFVKMKISVIIPVLDSHEIVRRQALYFKSLNLKDVEFIIIDDYSTPPLEDPTGVLKIYRTDSRLAWTQGLARNLGASKATGEYLLMTDIDHILDKKAFENVLDFDGIFMHFNRFLGILDEEGKLHYDRKSLREYGTHKRYLKADEPGTGLHQNTFAISKKAFEEVGGYQKEWCSYGFHPLTGLGDDVYMNGATRRYLKKHNQLRELQDKVYVFPNGRFHGEGELNPHGLWHTLHHKQERHYK
jgi:hypothetical protein